MKIITAIVLLIILRGLPAFSQLPVTTTILPGMFPIVAANTATPIYIDDADYTVVQKAATLLRDDIKQISSKAPAIYNTLPKQAKNIIIIGTPERSPIIQKLIANKKINVNDITNKWETYCLQTVKNPAKGIDAALVITGSDRRGCAYGVMELSKQMGVSPWYWWADVPVSPKSTVGIKNGTYHFNSPAVQYRGIFINDEAPALSGWAKEKFGGFNHSFYEKVFELMLRLKANYLWPAMWGSAFYDDDSINAQLADDYAIVIGTSHHEPMMRAHDEWRRYGTGKWNYDSNTTALNQFWEKGVSRMGNKETIVTIGMRGDGDEPMSEESNIALLEKIITNQRGIIEKTTGRPATATPQLWALYKEVQDYYDKGMRVPDDVTLLLCDDNWGNLRKLPNPSDPPRKGGYGIYYHFDYVGGPRNYKWINTNNIPRIWEQMHLAYEYNARKIWIVNVGDIKPMELPVSFFLDYAWNANTWNIDSMSNYTTRWAAQQFGSSHAKDIAYILDKYTQYNARRKPELLDDKTYSIENYSEWKNVMSDYKQLSQKASVVANQLPQKYQDAYYQLVLYPVQASENINNLYGTVAFNYFYASHTIPEAVDRTAETAKLLFQKDAQLSAYYNDTIANGKWRHMMDQTHIGYTSWQQPDSNIMPKVVINQVKSKTPGDEDIVYSVSMLGQYSSIEASKYTKAITNNKINWQVIPNIGRTADGITPFPVTAQAEIPGRPESVRLEYTVTINCTRKYVNISLYFSPTLNFNGTGLRYGISLNNEALKIVNIHEGMTNQKWERWVADNIIISTTSHAVATNGTYTLKYWMVDPGLVLQKIVVDDGSVKPSYLGPPATQ